MKKFPELNVDFLTVSDLSDRWSSASNAKSIEDRIIAHGKDGSLGMMVVGEKVISTLSTPNADGYKNYPVTPISKDQFTMLIDADAAHRQHISRTKQFRKYLAVDDEYRMLLVELFREQINEFRESDLYSSRFYPVYKKSIVVSKAEIVRFEEMAEQENIGRTTELETNLYDDQIKKTAAAESDALKYFTKPPQRNHEVFKNVLQLLIDNIEKKEILITEQMLWDLLIEKHVDTYEPNTKSIKYLSKSTKGLNYKAYRKLLSNWGWIRFIKGD